MIIMGKITKLFTFILLLLVMVYLLFPVWSGWVVKSGMPPNIEWHTFDVGYPGLQSVPIRDLQVKINGMVINITELDIDYKLADLSIGKVHLTKDISADSENALLRIPEFDISQLALLEKFKAIKINELEFKEQDTVIKAFHISFNKPDKARFDIGFEKIDLLGKSYSSLEFKTRVLPDINTIGMDIISSGNKAASLSYQFNEETLKLTADINPNNLQPLFKVDLSGLPVKSNTPIEVEWIQNKLNNKLQLIIRNDVMLTKHLLKEPSVKISTTDKNTSPTVEFPVIITITSETVNFPFIASLNITTRNMAGFELFSSGTRVQTKPLKIDVSSEVSVEKMDGSDSELYFKNTSVGMISQGVKVSSDLLPLEMGIDDAHLAMLLDDFQIPLSNVTFDKVLTRNWNLQAEMYAKKIQGAYIREVSPDSAGEEISILKFDANPEMKLMLSGSMEDSRELLTSGSLMLSELQITDSDNRLSGHYKLNWDAVNPQFTRGIFSAELVSDMAILSEIDIDAIKVNSNFNVSENTINGKGELMVNQHKLTPFEISMDKKSSELLISFEKSRLANPLLNELLNIYAKKYDFALKIIDGEISHEGNIALSEKLEINSNTDVSNVRLQFGENTIEGMNIRQVLDSIVPLNLKSDVKIKRIHFASGLDLNNFEASIESHTNTAFEIKSLKGRLFEGTLKSESIKINADSFSQSTVELSNVSLTELVFFMAIPGLYSEGKINFIIPVAMESGSLIITDGKFKAIDKGIIKYNTEQTQTNENENIALKALQNFHYDSLDGTLSYDKSGHYRITLHLLGANPDLYDGYPVDFNLNLQGELTGVFRSLFITGNFEQAVMEQVKSSQLDK